MFTADLLSSDDRCHRAGVWRAQWEKNRLHPRDILRRAIDFGLESEDVDPGQAAGDEVMTLCAERGLELEGSVYSTGMNIAALSDIVVTLLREKTSAWARPVDETMKTSAWVSSAYLEPTGVRLRRVICVDRWSDERKLSELHSWYCLGEMAAYKMPMTMTVVLIGQFRQGKYSNPFSKGFLHPMSRYLRIRKKSGEPLGGEWKPVWREECDHISRDKWIDQMHDDAVMRDVLFDVDVPLPIPEILSKIRHLAEKKLTAISEAKEAPPPNISVCDWPQRCMFADSCWLFTEPNERNGFLKII